MRTRRTLLAIGLDSADPVVVDEWIAAGHLPNLARLRAEGASCEVRGPELYLSEQAWTLVSTGQEATRTGYWSRWKFDPGSYAIRDTGAYSYREHPPFWALGQSYRCAIVDVPQAQLSPDVAGVQVLAWGARSARTASASEPPGLLHELVRRHGRHPAFDRDHASWWNPAAVAWLVRALEGGIRRRAAICRDLLARQRWDLFFTVFGETHSAGHFLWHLSREHPLHERWTRAMPGDPMLRVYRAVDRAVGEILAACPDADVVVFSPEGMEANSVDLPSTVLLPELLYRLSLGGEGLAGGDTGTTLGLSDRPPLALGWHRELYALRADAHPLRRRLRRWLPTELVRLWEHCSPPGPGPDHPDASGALFHQPPLWYGRSWPHMRAFALPSVAHGYVRLNVRGRERDGVVPPLEYEAVCDELAGELRALRDARSGGPLVRDVVRTRATAMDDGPQLPDADLVVLYHPTPVDVVDSPRVGRIGPVPWTRTGGHTDRGFAIVRAPGCAPGSTLPPGHVRDLAPTMLALLGAPIPPALDGRSLVDGGVPAAAIDGAAGGPRG